MRMAGGGKPWSGFIAVLSDRACFHRARAEKCHLWLPVGLIAGFSRPKEMEPQMNTDDAETLSMRIEEQADKTMYEFSQAGSHSISARKLAAARIASVLFTSLMPQSSS